MSGTEKILSPSETDTTIFEAPDQAELSTQYDQTRFGEDSVLDRAARPRKKVEAAPAATDSAVPVKKRNPKLVLVGVLGVVALVVLPVLSLLTRRAVTTLNHPSASPTPSVAPAGSQSELEKRMILLEQDVAAADPIQLDLAYPPINFELNLQDATSPERLEEQRNSRQR